MDGTKTPFLASRTCVQEYPAAKIASVPSFAPNAAAALKAVVSRSEGSSFIDVLAEEGMLGLLLDWLKNLEKRDDVVASVCGLLVDICKLVRASACLP
eukprot:SAG11_NODE_636_length_8034_cov_5.199118_14_plen_98_part_00